MKKTSILWSASLVVSSLVYTSCGRQTVAPSKLDVTDVEHTPAKRQSIGNCWIYATATWAESLHLTATKESVNLSESYWTYWDWYSKLQYTSAKKLETGGNWFSASSIIQDHGWMQEGDFLPNESDVEMSTAQMIALSRVNRELEDGGRLADRDARTPELIRKVLDEAFDVKMDELMDNAQSASNLVVGKDSENKPVALADVISGSGSQKAWKAADYPVIYGKTTNVSPTTIKRRKEVMTRVLRALNDGQPVIMSVRVDFNALKTEPYATFDLPTLVAAGMGHQGGHLLVLDDYTVKNVPGYGYLGEGNMKPEIKAAALEGELVTLKAKNSWGINRPQRGLIDGHTAFTAEYINASIPWSDDGESTNQDEATWYSPLSDFVLPPGY